MTVNGEVYSIQHCVIKCGNCLRQGRWFPPRSPVSSTEKTDHHDMTEILMKVGLNTINYNHNLCEILLSFFIDGHFF